MLKKIIIPGAPLLIAISGIAYFIYLLQPVSGEAAAKTLIIPPQTGFGKIADDVYALRLIRSETAFKIYAALSGNADKLKPGRYALDSSFSAPKIIETLAAGPQEISATIVPGMTLKEIDDELSDLEIIEKNSLIEFKIDNLKNRYRFLEKARSLEGFLPPDTYNFFSYSETETVIDKFLDNFEQKIIPLTADNGVLRLLNIASLLEKEIPFNDERQIAAGILEKRLKSGMALQIDAAIVYAKCSGRFFNCPALKESDYKIDSPYNTYLYAGLPPAPVSNPSAEAIKAAANPIASSYWYYLSDPKTKKTIFAKTLDEHNQNRVKYLLNK